MKGIIRAHYGVAMQRLSFSLLFIFLTACSNLENSRKVASDVVNIPATGCRRYILEGPPFEDSRSEKYLGLHIDMNVCYKENAIEIQSFKMRSRKNNFDYKLSSEAIDSVTLKVLRFPGTYTDKSSALFIKFKPYQKVIQNLVIWPSEEEISPLGIYTNAARFNYGIEGEMGYRIFLNGYSVDDKSDQDAFVYKLPSINDKSNWEDY